ncbi:hypothetical protein [Natrinema sp. 1APR25-10V2]|uniref:hypothetical protein n=1 Tax=Natrinema sp. 1APR25-10V2 TaxID=2951081 RepID=UPI00287456B7|nr:hypothetical protein [Natrinema sp. 1APR25-10V2]MDS0476431.1 hypothetical protein [Natrinema sp. 1APR25-10V2]
MTPPPTAALALLGVWALMIFWVTAAGTAARSRADDRLEVPLDDGQSERHERRSESVSSSGSFPTSDD